MSMRPSRLAAAFLNSGDDFVRPRLIRAEAQRHVRAFHGESFHDRASNALVAPGNRRNFPIQSVCHVALLGDCPPMWCQRLSFVYAAAQTKTSGWGECRA